MSNRRRRLRTFGSDANHFFSRAAYGFHISLTLFHSRPLRFNGEYRPVVITGREQRYSRALFDCLRAREADEVAVASSRDAGRPTGPQGSRRLGFCRHYCRCREVAIPRPKAVRRECPHATKHNSGDHLGRLRTRSRPSLLRKSTMSDFAQRPMEVRATQYPLAMADQSSIRGC